MKLKISSHLQILESSKSALCFHSLRGNLFFLNLKYLNYLKTFFVSRKIETKEVRKKAFKDLIKNNYIVNDLLDERSFLFRKNKQWINNARGGGKLQLLDLMISESCNFGCKHCLHKCSVQTSPSHGQKKLMEWKIAKTAIDKYVTLSGRNNNKNLNVHFGAAEPLLNWDVLEKAIIYIRQIDSEANIAINTNLSLINLEKAEFFRDQKVNVASSLDGSLVANDAIRIFSNGSGTFEKIIEVFNLFKRISYPLDGFSITINDINFDLVNIDFIDWAKEFGVKGIACDIDLINIKNSSRSISDCVNKLMQLRKKCFSLGLENFGSWTTAYNNLVNPPKDSMPAFCKAVKGRNISVNPEGRIFICSHTTTQLGNLTDFEKLFEAGGSYLNLVESRLPGNNYMCFNCEIEGVCAGQCHITREVSRNSGNGKDKMLCDFYRLATKELLKEKLYRESNL